MSVSSLIARAPAKLILSGEHSVLYGQPALAVAVNCYAHSKIKINTKYYESNNLNNRAKNILFNLLNLKYTGSVTLATLSALKKRLQKDYLKFLRGECSIREVIKKPFELLQFTVMQLLDRLDLDMSKLDNVELETNSEIPIGCGMGSSAASIVATLKAIHAYFGINIEKHNFLKLAREAENLQHGYSSGLDLYLCLNGGVVKYQNSIPQQLNIKELDYLPMYLINTGTPISTTGECVEKVKQQNFSASIWDDFGDVTQELHHGLLRKNISQIKTSVKENHKLLQTIGVIPEKIKNLISHLESNNAAAKICGAGAIHGDSAGVLLVITENDVSRLIDKFGYTAQPLVIDNLGTVICA